MEECAISGDLTASRAHLAGVTAALAHACFDLTSSAARKEAP